MTRFASSVEKLRSSQIRDLMALATAPGIISFAGGMPGNELFPLEDIDKLYGKLTAREKQIAMQYGPTCGLPSLIESIGGLLAEKGISGEGMKVMITTGSLQAINILAKAFIDPGDTILVENPSFIGALSAFKSYGANIIGVDMDSDGINLDALKATLELTKNKPKFLYITPTFHNPGGLLYSRKRRKELIELMAGLDIPIIEDDAYGDLYFYEEDRGDLMPMVAMGHEGVDICYTGSLSKIIGPGLRIGYMVVPEHIYNKCELIKQSMDACSPSFTQVIADKFIRSGAIDSYIKSIRREYRTRAEVMDDCLHRWMPEYIKWEKPRGGFYIWLRLPEGVLSMDILPKAIEKGVVFVAGKTFDPNGEKDNAMRISYCNTAPDAIRKGIKLLAEAVKEICEQNVAQESCLRAE